MSTIRAGLTEQIDEMLERLIFTRREKLGRDGRSEALINSLNHFSPMYALTETSLAEDEEDIWYFGPSEITRPDVVWPLDFSTCCWKPADPAYEKDGNYLHTIRFRSGSPSEFRGFARKFVPRMAFISLGFVHEDSFKAARGVVGWINGKWRDVSSVGFVGRQWNDDDEHVDVSCKMIAGLALTRRYRWCVSFGIDDSPKVMLDTDPTGLKELFKDRDKDGGDGKRAALHNWVRDHWRKSRRSEADEIYVRQHLRGRMPFRWRGYDCVVEPAPFDVEVNERIREARQESPEAAMAVLRAASVG